MQLLFPAPTTLTGNATVSSEVPALVINLTTPAPTSTRPFRLTEVNVLDFTLTLPTIGERVSSGVIYRSHGPRLRRAVPIN